MNTPSIDPLDPAAPYRLVAWFVHQPQAPWTAAMIVAFALLLLVLYVVSEATKGSPEEPTQDQ